jgi:hypothetical protein
MINHWFAGGLFVWIAALIIAIWLSNRGPDTNSIIRVHRNIFFGAAVFLALGWMSARHLIGTPHGALTAAAAICVMLCLLFSVFCWLYEDDPRICEI